MIIDKRTEFAKAVALNTGGAGDYVIGDQVDLSVAGRDAGLFEDLWFVVRVDTSCASANSTATLAVSLATSANADLSAADKLVTSPAYVIPAAGTLILAVKLPKATYKRYLGIIQTTGVQAFSDGKIDAFLVSDLAAWKAYADAVN